MADIAARAGVSQASVSLVLNNAPGTRISAATRGRVLAAAEELGYRRAALAPARRPGRAIGLLLNEFSTTPHAASLLEGARDEAAGHGCLVAVIATQGAPEIEAAALDRLAAEPLAGIIYATLITRPVEPPERLRAMPAVLLNCHATDQNFVSVVPGDLAAGFAATSRLLEAGHRRIAMIGGEAWIEASRDRVEGYRQALTTFDLTVDPSLIRSGAWTPASGREFSRRLLDGPDPPTAFFCFSDRLALGVYEAVREKGLRIPEDVSVIGFDDESFSRHISPPLTTMLLPHEEMARWAVSQLLEGPASASGRRPVKMECCLIERGSVAPPPGGRQAAAQR